MTNTIKELLATEEKAIGLFKEIENRKLIVAGKSEKQLNNEVFALAEELYSIKKYWHKRIVRAGRNTLLPYRNNPPNLIIQHEDILFFDFGPVFEKWEADIGRTFVLGNDESRLKLQKDVEEAWQEGLAFYLQHKANLTGAEFYTYSLQLAAKYSWEYGNIHCGHLIGKFPHERISGEQVTNYIHPNNHQKMCEWDKHGNERHWILEIHFIDREKQIGGFFEQLLIEK